MTRVRMEGANGYDGHAPVDVTDEPAPTIQAGREVTVEVEQRSRSRRRRKPPPVPYELPPAGIAKRSNGYRVFSTFSGAGGSCLGFKWAGFRTLYANEFVEAARETYHANFPRVALDDRDVRDVTGDSMRALAKLDGELDVLEGSPPCANFSTAGQRQRSWGQTKKYSDTEQRSDDLFFEYARLVRELQPRVFVAENVQGLAQGVAIGYFERIRAALEDAGYVVAARLLDAQWLGVPQRRKRVFIIGVRKDLNVEAEFPTPLPYRYSVRDAIPWLDGDVSTGHGERSGDEPAPTVQTHGNPHTRSELTITGGKGAPFDHKGESFDPDEPIPAVVGGQGGRGSAQYLVGGSGAPFDHKGRRYELDDPVPPVMAQHHRGGDQVEVVEHDPSLEGYAIGREYDRLRPGETSKRYLNLIRPRVDEPLPTVTQTGGIVGAASVVHPTEKRKFTIVELRRLCGFPDDFVLTGSYSQQWERLGRAVPPPMAYAVARSILATLRAADR